LQLCWRCDDRPEANKYGALFGDEYFVDLDLIETTENTKEGYENEVENHSSVTVCLHVAAVTVSLHVAAVTVSHKRIL